jgi:hypothetical protein
MLIPKREKELEKKRTSRQSYLRRGRGRHRGLDLKVRPQANLETGAAAEAKPAQVT